MTTEKINLAAPAEPVGNPAEDAQKTTNIEVNNEQVIENQATTAAMSENFADEEAALAAQEAGLELGDETEEEAEDEAETEDAETADEEF